MATPLAPRRQPTLLLPRDVTVHALPLKGVDSGSWAVEWQTRNMPWLPRQLAIPELTMVASTATLTAIRGVNGAIVLSNVGADNFVALGADAHVSRNPVLFVSNELDMLPYLPGEIAETYERTIRGAVLDNVFVSWLYSRRGPLAMALKHAKGRVPGDREAAVEALCGIAWANSAPAIKNWARGEDVAVVPIPGAGDLAGALARDLCGRQMGHFYLADVLARPVGSEVKDLPWSERDEHVKSKFFLAERPVLQSVLLIDDVVTSGATARECARLLRNRGSVRVAIASIAAAPEDAPWAEERRRTLASRDITTSLTPQQLGVGLDHDARVNRWVEKAPDPDWLTRFRSLGLPYGRLADLGTGSGGYSALLQQSGYETVGLDVDLHSLVTASSRHEGLTLIRGRIESIPMRDKSFGIVLLRYVIHHLPRNELAAAICEASRLLQDGAYLVIETSYPRDFVTHFDNVIFPPLHQKLLDAYHDRSTLAAAFAQAGLESCGEVESVRKQGFFTTVEAALQNSARLVSEDRGPRTWMLLSPSERVRFHEARMAKLPVMFPDNRVPREWRGRFVLARASP